MTRVDASLERLVGPYTELPQLRATLREPQSQLIGDALDPGKTFLGLRDGETDVSRKIGDNWQQLRPGHRQRSARRLITSIYLSRRSSRN